MSKEQEFITIIQNVLLNFEKNENNISAKNAKDILHIRGLLEDTASYIELHALLTDYVVNDMSRKFFGFLPFINDLKANLLDVIKNPNFDPMRWLHEERRSRRNSSCSSLSNLSEIIVNNDALYHQDCESRFLKLEKDIKLVQEKNEYLKTKNDELEKVVTLINNDYLKIKAELDKVNTLLTTAKYEIDRLNLIILQKDEIISKLSSENEKLKNITLSSKTTERNDSQVKKSIIGFFS